MTAIRLQNIHHGFSGQEVLDGIDLEVRSGEFLVILGASGAGKTTLLYLLAGLIPPGAGTIWFDAKEVTHLDVVHRNAAFVFQDYALYPHMTVEENIRFPLENQGVGRDAVQNGARRVLSLLHLESCAGKYPRQLSGGQKQRVALGRALVRDPAVFFFDEPLSSLDPQLRDHLRGELKALHRQLGRTFVYVTHDAHSAMTLGDRIAFLGEKRIMQISTPAAMYAAPRSVEIARFLGTPPINLLPLADLHGLGRSAAPPGAVLAGLRPENLRAVRDPAGEAAVDWVQDLGAARFAHVGWGDQTLCALGAGESLEPGDRVRLLMDDDKIMFFDENETTIGMA
ncbi:MAG: ABC transporter ATP-binding protein [Nitrospinaceae bacterium]